MKQLMIYRSIISVLQNSHAKCLIEQQKRHLYLARFLLQKRKYEGAETTGSLQETSSSRRSDVSTDVRPLKEKIKENTKTASYTAIIIAGIGVTGIMFWTILRELFSSFSPNNVYTDALDRVKEDTRVQDSLGTPIKGFGEESRRGRRQRVAHIMFERAGIPHMRMKFYIVGLRNKATVQLESRKTSSGKIEYRYLFVQLDHYPHTTIILEDNRINDASLVSTQIEPNTAF